MILWWKRNLKLRCNLKVSMYNFAVNIFLKMNPKIPNPYIKTGCVKLLKQLQKLIMLKNNFKDKQTYFNENLYKLCIKQLFTV